MLTTRQSYFLENNMAQPLLIKTKGCLPCEVGKEWHLKYPSPAPVNELQASQSSTWVTFCTSRGAPLLQNHKWWVQSRRENTKDLFQQQVFLWLITHIVTIDNFLLTSTSTYLIPLCMLLLTVNTFGISEKDQEGQ